MASLTSRVWRLLRDAPADGAANMARDEALLGAVARGGPPTLRLYAWIRPTLSLGAHQTAADADLAACRRLGVDLVRRPTGGGAVLHHLEVTYAVAGRLGDPPFPRSVVSLYGRIGEALIAALSRLGVHAEMSGGGPGRAASDLSGLSSSDAVAQLSGRSGRSPAHCFGTPSSRELIAGGRKLVGSAQVRRRELFLQHGSILVDLDEELLVQVLPAARRERGDPPPRGQSQAAPRPGMGVARSAQGSELGTPALALESASPPPAPAPTTLRELLGRRPPCEEIEESVVAGFRAAFESGIEPSHYDPAEQEEAATLRAFKYLDGCWTLQGKLRPSPFLV